MGLPAAPCEHTALLSLIFQSQAGQSGGSLEVFGSDGGRDGGRVGSLDVGGIGAPASGLEGNSVEEAIVEGNQTLADAVGDLGQVTRAQLVGDQTVRTRISATLCAVDVPESYSSTRMRDMLNEGSPDS